MHVWRIAKSPKHSGIFLDDKRGMETGFQVETGNF
jgi:hypothetical protein